MRMVLRASIPAYPNIVILMESEKESVKDLIVDVRETEVQLALMDNHKLIEFNKESLTDHSLSLIHI